MGALAVYEHVECTVVVTDCFGPTVRTLPRSWSDGPADQGSHCPQRRPACRETLRRLAADIRAGGATSLRAIAGELNARGMLTRRGGRWHVSTVTNLLDRLGVREAACASRG